MKRLLGFLCLLAVLVLPAACGAPAPAPKEVFTYELDGITLTLPEGAREIRWTAMKGGGVQAEFTWGEDEYVYRAKKTESLKDLSGMEDLGLRPEHGDWLAPNTPRSVVDRGMGCIDWYAQGHSFALSMSEGADAEGKKLQALYEKLRIGKGLSDFTEPPALTVRCGGRKVSASRTTFNWTCPKPGGRNTVFADGIHPLQMLDKEGRVKLTPLPVPAGAEVELVFELMPKELTVRCWPEEAARGRLEGYDYDAEALELVVTEGKFTPGADGNTIYEVTAAWEDGSGNGGTACYGFYTTSAGAGE